MAGLTGRAPSSTASGNAGPAANARPAKTATTTAPTNPMRVNTVAPPDSGCSQDPQSEKIPRSSLAQSRIQEATVYEFVSLWRVEFPPETDHAGQTAGSCLVPI